MKAKLKPIIRIIAFVCILAIMTVFISYMVKPDSYNLQNIEGLYGEKENSFDVIYIGGSAAFVYYAPPRAWENYGIVSYDYAADTIQIESYKYMITEVLKTQDPKLIILDARAFQYRDKDNIDAQPPGEVPYRNVLTGMRLSKNKIDFIYNNIKYTSDSDKLPYIFDILKYHNSNNFKLDNIKMLFKKYKHPYNGFLLNPSHKRLEKPYFMTDEIGKLSKETNDIFEDLLDFLDSTKRDYLFVVSTYEEKPEHKQIFNYVQSVIENRGYRFIDTNEYIDDMNVDYSTDFYHEGHMNIYGAEKYTDFISKYIIENYNIPDRRNDSNYEYMNDYLDQWHNEVNNTKSEIDKIIEENNRNEE